MPTITTCETHDYLTEAERLLGEPECTLCVTDAREDYRRGDAGLPFFVYDPRAEDIIGGGFSSSEAAADALKNARNWAESEGRNA